MSKEENQNIEELANEIAFIFVNKCNKDGIKYETIAEDLYNAGYRKQVWHKVANGDLPSITDAYLCEMKWHGLDVLFYSIERGFFSSGYPINKDDVIAWTELPKYEEE